MMTTSADTARSAATQIVARLVQAGHTAYLAGGCVRDALLGHTPKDYDVATDATPDIVQNLFPNSAAVGAAFGVVLVYTAAPRPLPRWATEVATFRAEGAYSDGRRPDEVRFTGAQEDASRRDFTINGLFALPDADHPDDPGRDRVIDYVAGQADLESRTLRAIGDPAERFGEDYLRMLRAVRFAARLGFTIESKTSAALRAYARYLGQISRERIGQEVRAMLTSPSASLAIALMQQHKLDGPTLNEDACDAGLQITQRLDAAAELPARLAAWLIDRHGPSHDHTPTVKRWRKALNLSNEHRDELNKLLAMLRTLDDWARLDTPQRKRTAAKPEWQQTLLVFQAMGNDADSLRRDAERLAADGIGLAPEPLLTGEDLIAKGLTPGPSFKTLLDQAYDRQLEAQLTTRADALKWLARHAGQS